jgi:hypothetical protein
MPGRTRPSALAAVAWIFRPDLHRRRLLLRHREIDVDGVDRL